MASHEPLPYATSTTDRRTLQSNAMVQRLNEEDALERFDRLKALGIISHGPSRPVAYTDNGFQFEFRICPSWSKKPLTVTDTLDHDNRPEPEKFGPGSDIYRSHPDQVITIINGTHTLALNIFPVFRPQYLLLTTDSYRSQDESLDSRDIDAAWKFLHSTTTPHFVMYNCTKHAGCSRYHKHMQILPKPEVEGEFRFFLDGPHSDVQTPYVHFKHFFAEEKATNSAIVFDIYQNLLEQCKEVLDSTQPALDGLVPHNVLLVQDWIAVIPRRRGDVHGIGANSAGMMGMPTISNDKLFKTWMDIGPANVLCELGVPAECEEVLIA